MDHEVPELRYGAGGVAVAALAVVLVACVSERARPLEPTTQGPGGGGSSAPPSDQARVRVVSPVAGDTILRATFIEAPGKEVVVRGDFSPGHRIAFEGYANRYGPIPFHSEVFEVQQDGVVEVTSVFQAQEFHLNESNRATLRAQVRNGAGTLLAADSVVVELR